MSTNHYRPCLAVALLVVVFVTLSVISLIDKTNFAIPEKVAENAKPVDSPINKTNSFAKPEKQVVETTEKVLGKMMDKTEKALENMATRTEKALKNMTDNTARALDNSGTKTEKTLENMADRTEKAAANAKTTDRLKVEFDKKLSLPAVSKIEFHTHCLNVTGRGNSCDGPCNRLTIDDDVKTRISQIVEPPHLQMTSQYHQIVKEMGEKVKGHYDIIFLTAASNNHYLESQGLVKILHQEVFPHLTTNYTLVYYNLGLTASNRAHLVKHCKCQVIDFPFDKFPEFSRTLNCYTWKPAITKAHLKQSNVLVYLDASIRFDKGPKFFDEMVSKTKQRGLLVRSTYGDIAFRTWPMTFHFFGEEPCAYVGLAEIMSGFIFLSNEFWVERLILEPWVACALDRKCMCPKPYPKEQNHDKARADWRQGKAPMHFRLGHRFDQSALNLIVLKLYKERFYDVITRRDLFTVRRGAKKDYFPKN